MIGTPMQWSIPMTHTRTYHIYSYSGPLTNDEEQRKGNLVSRLMTLDWWTTPPMHDPSSIYTIKFNNATDPYSTPCMVLCSKNIRKSCRVPDHDTAVMTDLPKMTSICIHYPHVSPHHGPQGESTRMKIHISTYLSWVFFFLIFIFITRLYNIEKKIVFLFNPTIH